MKAYVRRFGSFGAFCQAALVPATGANFPAWDAPHTDESFYGSSAPLPEVARALQAGWPEGVETMREILGHVPPPAVRSIRRKQTWDAQGDSVDMQRVYRGDIDRAFRRTIKAPVGIATHVRFVINWASPHSVSKGQLFFRGACVSALVESLTHAGYMSSVWIAKRSNQWLTHNDTPFELGVCVKDYTNPLALAPLVAATAHAAAYRRIGFAVMLNTQDDYTVRGNLGLPQTAATIEDFADVLPREPATVRTIYVPADLLTEAAARDFVKRTIRELEGSAAA